MVVHRRVSGMPFLAEHDSFTAAHSDHATGLLGTISRDRAQRYALWTGILAVVLIGWSIMLSHQAEDLNTLVLSRVSLVEDASEEERMCARAREAAQATLQDGKDRLRSLRRSKNLDAMKYNHHEEACRQTVHKIATVHKPALEFEIMSLNAKMGSNETLIQLYRMVEALAKLQDKSPAELWAVQMGEQELRNSLILELSQLLAMEPRELQGLHTIELLQQVHDL